jgi:hypothetical protein
MNTAEWRIVIALSLMPLVVCEALKVLLPREIGMSRKASDV